MLGFGFNKTKVMASAERYIQQGRLSNAITEYQKILKHDTPDITVLNTVGDLYARLNQVEEATGCFQEVAETYAGTGFTVKAIAVYKKLSKLNPGNLEYVLKLGELYRQQGLLNDARSQYSQAADSKLRSGNTEEGTKLYEKILELDPENLALQTKLADLYLRLSRNPQASDLLLRLAENALRRGVLDGAEHALGRLTTMLPNDPKVLELKGRVALERGNPAQAAEFLENLPALQSTESGLQLLSTVYLQSGRIEKAVPVAKKLLVDFSHPEFLASCCDSLISSHRIAEALQLFTEFSDRLLSPTVIEKLQGCIVALREDPDALESLKKLLENAGDTTHSIEILELVAHASVQKGNLEHARDLYQQLMRLEPQDETHQHNYRQLQTGLETPSATGEEDSPTSAETATSTGDLYPEELEEKIRTALVEAELFENYDKSSGKAVASLEAALADATSASPTPPTAARKWIRVSPSPAKRSRRASTLRWRPNTAPKPTTKRRKTRLSRLRSNPSNPWPPKTTPQFRLRILIHPPAALLTAAQRKSTSPMSGSGSHPSLSRRLRVLTRIRPGKLSKRFGFILRSCCCGKPASPFSISPRSILTTRSCLAFANSLPLRTVLQLRRQPHPLFR
jgi:tetratricopeptide (TPR) repeat protein